MKKKIVCLLTLIAIIACSVFALAACNKDDVKVVTVGYTDYRPMNYENDNGELVGFDTELAKAVFEDLGYKVVMKEIKWENKYIDLNSGNIDCIWNGFTSNSDDDGTPRSQSVDFSYNYMVNYQAVVVKASEAAKYTDKATSFNDKIGYVEAGSAGVDYAQSLTGARVKEATSQMAAIREVNLGTASFAVVDYLLANSIVGMGDFSSLTFLPALNSDTEYYGIGFKKGSDLTAKVNATLEKFAADGTLATLAAKYDLSKAVITDFSNQK